MRKLATIAALIGSAATLSAQAPPTAEAAFLTALKVFISCGSCDPARLRSNLAFVDLVSDEASADVIVAAATVVVQTDQQWTLTITGHGRFTGQDRTVVFRVPVTAPATEALVDVERFLKLGLAEYAVMTARGRDLDVAFRRPPTAATTTVQQDQQDPWNYWVFRLGANAYGNGELSTSSGSYYLSGSASRTTDHWKMRFSGSRSLDTSSFTIDEDDPIKTRLTNWSIDPLIVKSVGPHWSVGLTTSVVGSTFSNSKLVGQALPGIEYDVFPYSESSRRSLTLQYNVGGAHYDYEHVTIFDKLSEAIALHSAIASLGLRQPWGQAGGSVTFNQHLTAPDRTRISLNGSMNVRLLRALTLNASGSYSRIRDQFTLEKGDATDEEVLLRQRQLATGFRYSFGVGISYSFGALENATVNPRFGG